MYAMAISPLVPMADGARRTLESAGVPAGGANAYVASTVADPLVAAGRVRDAANPFCNGANVAVAAEAPTASVAVRLVGPRVGLAVGPGVTVGRGGTAVVDPWHPAATTAASASSGTAKRSDGSVEDAMRQGYAASRRSNIRENPRFASGEPVERCANVGSLRSASCRGSVRTPSPRAINAVLDRFGTGALRVAGALEVRVIHDAPKPSSHTRSLWFPAHGKRRDRGLRGHRC